MVPATRRTLVLWSSAQAQHVYVQENVGELQLEPSAEP